MKKSLILLMIIFTVSAAVYGKEGIQIGNTLPEYTLYDVNSKKSGSTRDYLGKVTIFNFGATWCPYCTIERPLLREFSDNYKNDINVVFLMMDEPSDSLEKFFEEENNDQMFFDKGQNISNNLLIRGTPTSIFVDENGVIFHTQTGAPNWSMLTPEDIFKLRDSAL